jgi:predicted Zn-dependent protease
MTTTRTATLLLAAAILVTTALVLGCGQMAKVASQVAADQGMITQEEAGSINRTVEGLERYWTDITPEQEHYIGRAVAATLLAEYPPLDDPAANRYLNQLGQSLVLVSERPETFGGYRFLLLDSDEVNAFACPGGLILVTRGLVRCCESEDALAAVLAHEIGHVAGKHGLRAIKSSRLTSALTILATESARTFGSEDVAQLTEDLEGSISDITRTLVSSGYSRDLEREADRAAVAILDDIGYSPHGLDAMLEVMQRRWSPRGPGFMRTHPSPQDRRREVGPLLAGAAPLAPPAARQQRFGSALAGI